MNDDNDVKRLLNEQVDLRLGPRRSPPPFAMPTAAERARRRWFGSDRTPWALPLLAAACVAAVAAGAVGAGGLLADGKQSSPGTSPPTRTPHTGSPPRLHYRTAELGGARVAVPTGWTVGAPVNSGAYTRWCLQPAHPDHVARTSGCVINFSAIRAPHGPQPAYFDPDLEGWGAGDPPQYCAPDRPQVSEQTGDRTFGGRIADWRLFDRSCPDGATFESEQYVVATNPAYGIFAQRSDPTIHAAMSEIAQYSTLPGQRDPLRLADRGIVRSLTSAPGGVRVTIDRVVLAVNRYGARNVLVNNNPTTYTYLVPTAMFTTANVSVGQRVRLETDGVHVLTFGRDGA